MLDPEKVRSYLAGARGLDVIIFGQVFGGKPGEAPQDFRSFQLDGEELTIYFNTTETLRVLGADSITFDDSGSVVIPMAKKIIWGWHSYGKSQSPDNWCTYTYILQEDGDVMVAVEGSIRIHLSRFGNPDKKYPKLSHPALQLR